MTDSSSGTYPERHGFWFIWTVVFSVLVVLDLLSIFVEANITSLPVAIRCRIVDTVLTLPGDPFDQRDNEYRVRYLTRCPG